VRYEGTEEMQDQDQDQDAPESKRAESVNIRSAREYKLVFDGPDSRARNMVLLDGSASVDTWLRIIDSFPDYRRNVTKNRTLPVEALDVLSDDADFGVRTSARSRNRWRRQHPEHVEPGRPNPEDEVWYRLTEREVTVLSYGLLEWGGSAQPTDAFAIAMGFESRLDLLETGHRMLDDIRAGKPMTHLDWTRALLATELVFISNMLGAALDWTALTHLSGEVTLETIRLLQSHLVYHDVYRQVFCGE
jgi:hypothetical protein